MEKEKKSLNQILESYQKIEAKIIDNEGEVDDQIEKMLEINEAELKDKLDGYQGFVKYLEGQIDYLKTMESHYLKRRKTLENSVKKCKDSMVKSLSLIDVKKIKTSNYNFSLCNKESWSVDLEVIDDSLKNQLVLDGLAQNVFKVSISDIKIKYKDMVESDRPDWIEIKKGDYIRVS